MRLNSFLKLNHVVWLLVLSSVLLVAVIASAQSEDHNREDPIVVNVWAGAEPDSAVSAQAALSRDFAVSAMRAAAEIRDRQLDLANAIKNGLPLSEYGIASDRDRAADALQLAVLAAEGEADRAALMQLVNLFGNAQSWIDARVEDQRNARLGNYYMSASALDNDESFQNTVSCTNSLISMLASGRLAEETTCRNREDTIVVDMWAAAEPDPTVSTQAAQAALSPDFAAATMRAAAEIRDWQLHLAYTLKNGLPLSDYGIASDRDRAADALQLAALAAEGEADRAALMQLVNLFGDVQSWIDARVEDNRNLRLGNYSVSASALDDDESFQNTVSCANSLISMLASRRLAYLVSCPSGS